MAFTIIYTEKDVMNRRIMITSFREDELDKRIEEHISKGYKLKNKGVHKSYGSFSRVKYWAVLEIEVSEGLHL